VDWLVSGHERVCVPDRLLGPQTPQPAALGDPLRLDDLLGREGRAAKGAELSLPHQVAEHPQRLLDIGRVVGAVDLVQVDPVGPQPRQAVLDRLEDPAPRVAAAVGAFAHREVDLGGEHDVVTSTPQRLADDLLGLARGVHIGGVDEVDPLVEGRVDDADTVVVVGVAGGTEHHGAQAVDAHLDAGAAEGAVAHGRAPWSVQGGIGGSRCLAP
jgi:hypothetical protein